MIISLPTILIGVTILFVLLLTLRSFLSIRVCALCGAVFLSWVILLGLSFLGYHVDMVAIALLAGGSIVGGMYLLEEKLPVRYHVFRFPLFLTAITILYTILAEASSYVTYIVLGALWVVTVVLFFNKRTSRLKGIIKSVIDCCRNW